MKATCRVLSNTLLVLMVDEFERLDDLVGSNQVERTIYAQLRSLMQFEMNLTFILAGTHELEELSSEYRNLVHNIAVIREISFMDKKDAVDLIREPVAGKVLYEDNAVEELWRYTHGHPWLLQSLCYYLIEDMNRRGDGNYIALGHVSNTIQRFTSDSDYKLDSLWARCVPVDKDILITLAQSNKERQQGMTQRELLEALEKYSSEEIAGSLLRLIKRTLVEKSVAATGEVEYTHSILLFSYWLVATSASIEMEHAKANPIASRGRL